MAMSRLRDPVRRSRVNRPVVYSLIEYHLSRFHGPILNVDFSPDPDQRLGDQYAGIEYAGYRQTAPYSSSACAAVGERPCGLYGDAGKSLR
jgi:hypothetical protein